MEALPITLTLQILLPIMFTGDQLFPNAISVSLVLLSLHWWMMWSHRPDAPTDVSKTRLVVYDVLAFCGAFALLLLTNPNLLNDIASWFVLFFLAGAAWARNYYRVRDDEDADQLILSLKVCFLVMLGMLAFALVQQYTVSPNLNNTLITDLPIFFLSGMLALSFKRLSILKREQAQHIRVSRSLKTGSWIVAMTITWVAVIIGSLAFEALPPTILASIVNFFLSVLGWILNLFAYLLNLLPFLHAGASHLPAQPLPTSEKKPQTLLPNLMQHASNPNAQAFLIHMLELGAGIVLVVLVIVVVILLNKRGHRISIHDENEIREKLDKQMIRRERRAERKPPSRLEPLDPASVRAQYRELLTVMATQKLPRSANETPAEYQARLLTYIQSLPEPERPETPSDQAILAELTLAYTRERYGAKPLDREHQEYLRQQMPTLLQHLTKTDSKT